MLRTVCLIKTIHIYTHKNVEKKHKSVYGLKSLKEIQKTCEEGAKKKIVFFLNKKQNAPKQQRQSHKFEMFCSRTKAKTTTGK